MESIILLQESRTTNSNYLKKALVMLVPRSNCRQLYEYTSQLQDISIKITERMFCVGQTGENTCYGDSGGPAAINDEFGARLIGIVSGGVGCNNINAPTRFTSIPYFYDWILQVTKIKYVSISP